MKTALTVGHERITVAVADGAGAKVRFTWSRTRETVSAPATMPVATVRALGSLMAARKGETYGDAANRVAATAREAATFADMAR